MKKLAIDPYIKTGHAKGLCLLNLFKFLASIVLVYVVVTEYNKNVHDPVLTTLGQISIIEVFALLINYIVLQVFKSKGKGAGLIKFWNFLCFLIMLGLSVFVLVELIMIITGTHRANQQVNHLAQQVAGITTSTVNSISAILIIEMLAICAILLIYALYFFWIFKTFKHAKKESKANQLLPFSFSNYMLPKYAVIIMVLVGISIAFSAVTMLVPSVKETIFAQNALASYGIDISSLLNSNNTINLISLAISIVVFIETWLVHCCAKDFELVHLNPDKYASAET